MRLEISKRIKGILICIFSRSKQLNADAAPVSVAVLPLPCNHKQFSEMRLYAVQNEIKSIKLDRTERTICDVAVAFQDKTKKEL